jgi:hypothetical protein
MKKLAITALIAVGMSVGAFAQSQFQVDNTANNSLNPYDTQNGMVWINDLSPGAPLLIDPNIYTSLNAAVYVGTTPGNLTLRATFTGANELVVLDYGLVFNPNNTVYNVSGIGQNGTAYIKLDVWLDGYTENGPVGAATSGIFAQVTGGASIGGNPPTPPALLTSMPALIIPVPEPSTFALAGLGLAGLVIFRRRK